MGGELSSAKPDPTGVSGLRCSSAGGSRSRSVNFLAEEKSRPDMEESIAGASSFRHAIREGILSGERPGNRPLLTADMGDIDQAEEYRRLEALYAEMSDQEIGAMSSQVDDLTEIAQQVLRAEISKRGLGSRSLDSAEDPVEAARRALRAEISEQGMEEHRQDAAHVSDPFLRDPFPSGLDPAGFDMVDVWDASEASEAREVMNFLESEGFKAYLGPENVESVDDYRGSYEEGVKIKVMRFQAKFANVSLRRFAACEPEQEAAEDDDLAACCPKCNSRDIVFQSIDVEPGKEPGPDAKYNWTCDACGHQWTDDGIEKLT
jgi:hypothetical protein